VASVAGRLYSDIGSEVSSYSEVGRLSGDTSCEIRKSLENNFFCNYLLARCQSTRADFVYKIKNEFEHEFDEFK